MHQSKDEQGRFTSPNSEPLAEKALSVRVPVSIDQVVRSLPNRPEWLREAIVEKLKREELMQPNTASSESQGKGDRDNSHNQPNLTIAERLRYRERAFVDGPPDLSERETRKKIAQSATDKRSVARQD